MLRDSSQMSSTINFFKRESTVKKSASNESKNSSMTFLSCILQILQAFFKTEHQRDGAKHAEPASLTFDRSSATNGVCLLRGYSYSLLPSQLNLAVTSSASDKISNHIIIALCDFLAVLWGNTSISESVVSNDASTTLIEICKVGGLLCTGSDSVAHPSYVKFLQKAFIHYPYISRESTISTSDSSSAIIGSSLSRQLNIHLTELVLQTGESSKSEYVAGMTYLTDTLNDYMDSLQNKSSRVFPPAHVERIIRAWGTVFKTSRIDTNSVVSTLQLFQSLADQCVSSCSAENSAMLLCLYSCTCEYVEILSTNAECSSDAAVGLSVIIDIFKTFVAAWKVLSENDLAHHCQRIVRSFLTVLRQFPLDDDMLVGSCSDFFSSIIEDGIIERCPADVRGKLIETLLYLPTQAFAAGIYRFAVILAQRIEFQSETEQFFVALYGR